MLDPHSAVSAESLAGAKGAHSGVNTEVEERGAGKAANREKCRVLVSTVGAAGGIYDKDRQFQGVGWRTHLAVIGKQLFKLNPAG